MCVQRSIDDITVVYVYSKNIKSSLIHIISNNVYIFQISQYIYITCPYEMDVTLFFYALLSSGSESIVVWNSMLVFLFPGI